VYLIVGVRLGILEPWTNIMSIRYSYSHGVAEIVIRNSVYPTGWEYSKAWPGPAVSPENSHLINSISLKFLIVLRRFYIYITLTKDAGWLGFHFPLRSSSNPISTLY